MLDTHVFGIKQRLSENMEFIMVYTNQYTVSLLSGDIWK